MSVGATGFYSSVAVTVPQSQGIDEDRTAQETAGQSHHLASQLKAEDAAGVGATDGEDHESEDRDADGRRLWENQIEAEEIAKEAQKEAASADPAPAHLSKDATGQSGNQLDLTG